VGSVEARIGTRGHVLTQKVCSICQSANGYAQLVVKRAPIRSYWKCDDCNFIEVDGTDHLSLKDEAQFYQHHENCIDDPRYRQYATAVATEAQRRYSELGNGTALDFGCGPGPVVASLLREHGIPADQYDPVYNPDGMKQDSYSLIVACEVVEHFRKPRTEFMTVHDRLVPGGWFVIQTERLDFVDRFEDWYYRRDPTHIAFYSERTFRQLALGIGFDRVEIVDKKLVSMRRPY